MFERFAKDARVVVARAAEEARELGSPTVEAEHMLLALAADAAAPTGALLAAAGLDHDGVRAALERETERSLAAVGVAVPDLPEAPRDRRRQPRFAASIKRALERAARVAGARDDRRMITPHLLIGVLRADVGTVPRALAAAGVDRVALATRAERLLDERGRDGLSQ
jgi:ATP-dependent Clp protease ATP-binding subunit ClpA